MEHEQGSHSFLQSVWICSVFAILVIIICELVTRRNRRRMERQREMELRRLESERFWLEIERQEEERRQMEQQRRLEQEQSEQQRLELQREQEERRLEILLQHMFMEQLLQPWLELEPVLEQEQERDQFEQQCREEQQRAFEIELLLEQEYREHERHQLEHQRQLEQQRQEQQQWRLEQRRLLEHQRLIDQQRQLEQQRREEQQRAFEIELLLEQEYREHERHQLEHQRQLEQQRQEQQQWRLEQRRLLEHQRLIDQQRQLEQQRQVVGQLLLEQQRQMDIKSILTPLVGVIQLTSSQDHPDMITFDDSPRCVRVIMPCGHVISPESMVDFCSDILSKGKSIFICPDPECDVSWDYFVVRRVASVSASASELEEFDRFVSENYFQRDMGMQKCPVCMTWCSREDASNNCVICLVCRRTSGQGSMFCWCCLGQWKSELMGKKCGNANCDGVDKRIAILSDCPNKLILDRWSPAMRGCPNCGLLIEYLEFCSQMNCRACKHYFCFFCLKGAKTKGELTCDPYNSLCHIAARQTVLPGM